MEEWRAFADEWIHGVRDRAEYMEHYRAVFGEDAADLEVFGAEVVAPLADAMRLVDGDEPQVKVVEQRSD